MKKKVEGLASLLIVRVRDSMTLIYPAIGWPRTAVPPVLPVQITFLLPIHNSIPKASVST